MLAHVFLTVCIFFCSIDSICGNTQMLQLKEALMFAVGIYRSSNLTSIYNLHKTVLFSSISTWDLSSHQYRESILNWLCARENMNQKSVVLVDYSADSEQSEHDFARKLSTKFPLAKFVPVHYSINNFLLQKLVKSLETNKLRTKLYTILATRDMISLGFDAVYSDTVSVDARDYFPYLSNFTNGPSDVLVVPVVAGCNFPTQDVDYNPQLETTELHNNFVYFRSSRATYSLLSMWYDGIIGGKISSPWSLRASLIKYSNKTLEKYCFPTSSPYVMTRDIVPIANVSTANMTLSYCYLSEFVFQTFAMADSCHTDQRYSTGMLCAHDAVKFGANDILSPGILIPTAEYRSRLQKQMKSIAGSGDTWKCKAINFQGSIFADPAFVSAVGKESQSRDYFTDSVLHQGSLIQFFSLPYIYVLDKRRLRLFPSMDVFLGLQFQWNDIRKHDRQTYFQFIKGADVTDTDIIPRLLPSGVIDVVTKSSEPILGLPPPVQAPTAIVYSDWVNLANKTYDPHREKLVKVVLNRASGVYIDKNKSMGNPRLQKTVLINVISDSKDNYGNSRYLMLLKNWFCFAEQYGYNPVTYWVPLDNKTNTHSIPRVLTEAGIRTKNLMSYPQHLFWKYLSQKKNEMQSNRASYDGDIPSFSNHGALVMLIPLLEALEYGYNILYFDLDTIMIHDPVPYMMYGHADFTVQNEMRNCLFPSSPFFVRDNDWERIEPNTGIFLVRSTEKGVVLFRKWLTTIVEQNIMNDQKVLDFATLHARITFSCNPTLAHLDNDQHFMQRFKKQPEDAPTFCYLNEIQFQNGKIALGCARGLGGSKAEYLQELYIHGARPDGQINSTIDVSKSMTIHPGLAALPRPFYNFTAKKEYVVPLMLHFNYCDDKIGEIMGLNAWLPTSEFNPIVGRNKTVCSKFNMAESSFGKVNWPQEIAAANQELKDAREQFLNGSLVKLHRRKQAHLVVNGELRLIPDHDTLIAMGYTPKQLKIIKLYNFVQFLKFGDDLPKIEG